MVATFARRLSAPFVDGFGLFSMSRIVQQQEPQSVPALHARAMSDTVRAPSSMARPIVLSETPLQTQMITALLNRILNTAASNNFH